MILPALALVAARLLIPGGMLSAQTQAPSLEPGAMAERTSLSATAPSGSALEPGQQAYHTLLEAFGREGMGVLVERGYVVPYGDKKQPGLLHAQWESLQGLAERAQAVQDFLLLYDHIRAGQNPKDDAPDISALLNPPAAGLWTHAAKSAAEFISAHLENLAALGPEPLAYKAEPLFKTSWGARFRSRFHAETIADFRPLARVYFAEFLAAPERPEEAARHLSEYVRSVYGKDIIPLLQSDLTVNSPSEATIGWIAKYLLDQKRLYDARLTPERLKTLERATGIKNDLRELSLLAPRLGAAGKALELARARMRADSSARAHFSAEKLHVHREAASPLDVGDSAVVSAAYWVEGLEPGESLEVTQAGFMDNGILGVSDSRVASYRRRNGGPYVFTARVPLDKAGQNKYVLLLGAPDAKPLRLETSISVSPRLDEFMLRVAGAENLAGSCRMDRAAREFGELDRQLSSLEKPQFKKLRTALKPRAQDMARQAAEYKTLLGAMPGVRLYASSEQCDFRDDRARRALFYLQALPAGCDLSESAEEGGARTPLAVELNGLFEATERRNLNQRAFHDALSKAQASESACRSEEAAQLYSAALALLDSDPAARCGTAENEYTKIRIDALPRALSASAMRQSFVKSYSEAARRYAAKDFAGALNDLEPLIGRIDALPDGKCYRSQRREAEDLALAAGVGLGPSDLAALKPSLPEDDFEREMQEISAERKRLAQLENMRREREQSRQSPTAPSSGPGLAPETSVDETNGGKP